MSTEANTKKKPHFTIFDVLIAIVVVAVIAVIAYVLVIAPMQGTGAQKQFYCATTNGNIDISFTQS